MKTKKSASLVSRAMRIGIATITSTALVGGTLVAVPAHPLLPVTAVAQAQQSAVVANDVSTADAQLIDLDLLNLAVLDAFTAEKAWPQNSGEEFGNLNAGLLGLEVEIADGISIPLIKDSTGSGLLDLGGDGLGALNAYAKAEGVQGAKAASGAVGEDGAVNLDPTGGEAQSATVDLTALLDQLQLADLTDELVDTLELRVGAVGSSVEKNGDVIEAGYTVADLELVIGGDLLVGLSETLNGTTATLDQTIDALAGGDGLVNGLTANVLGPLLEIVGIGTPEITVNTDLQALTQTLITDPIFEGPTAEESLVVVDLGAGELRINLDELHGGDLNDLDPGTVLDTAQLQEITDTLNQVLQNLVNRVNEGVKRGLLSLDLTVDLPLARDGGLLGPILGPVLGNLYINSTLGGLLGYDEFVEPKITSSGLVGGVLGSVLGVATEITQPIGQALQRILEDEVDDLLDGLLGTSPVDSLLGGLSPLLDPVLTEVLKITVNEQETLDGGLSVTALDVQLLPVVGDDPVVQLALANSAVTSPSQVDIDDGVYAPSITVVPNEGPFGEETSVKIEGENLVARDEEGELISLVTKLTFGIEVVSAGDITPNADGSLTVNVPVATANEDEAKREVTVTLTTGGGEDTDQFTYLADEPTTPPTTEPTEPTTPPTTEPTEPTTPPTTEPTPDPTDPVDPGAEGPEIGNIDSQNGTEGKEINPVEVVVTGDDVTVVVEGLPDGVDYNPETGLIEGTPDEGTAGRHDVTVTATNEEGEDIEEFVFIVTKPGETPPASGGSENGSSEFLQQCLNSPAAGVASLLVVLGAVGAIGGPALEPMFKAIGGELDRQLRMMVNVTAGAHQPVWVRNINKGLNDAANAVDHRMVTNALFATAALALASSPILCGMDNSSSGSSESN